MTESIKLTEEDIAWWEQFLSVQIGPRSSGFYPLIEQLLKLTKAVKELQEK